MDNVFIETTKGGSYFADINKELIEDPNIKYLFPMNYEQIVCYKISRKILKDLIDCGLIHYDLPDAVSEKEYSRFFEKRSVSYTKHMVEYCHNELMF